MPHHETIALSGIIQHVFAHRFTLDANGKVYLADLTPKGADAFPLANGLKVQLEGEQRPSEIKVTLISAAGQQPVQIHHNKPHHAPGHRPKHGGDYDSALIAALKDRGWEMRGEPKRKPKHVELLARRGEGPWTELHVDFSGTIYKEKAPDAEKWGQMV